MKFSNKNMIYLFLFIVILYFLYKLIFKTIDGFTTGTNSNKCSDCQYENTNSSVLSNLKSYFYH